VRSRAARVQGVGEMLTDLEVPRPIPLVVATPNVAKSTGNVFRRFDELDHVARPDTQGMVAALASGDLGAIAAHLGNVFEPVMLPRYPEIGRLKDAMLAGGALGALMSGAGPTVFGIVPDNATGLRLVETLRPHTKHIFFTHTLV
jgi:4-diphosphocytidyl-2-C-methyl-D-erythritol kinase